jgi:hypothetical protein
MCEQIMDGFAGSTTNDVPPGWMSDALEQAVLALTEVSRLLA